MDITTEHDAIQALDAVLAWAKQKPDSSHGGPTTGLTYQRGCVIATRTHDGTVGLSTYPTPVDAALKAADMETVYGKWRAMRNTRVTVVGPVTIVDRPPEGER